MSKAQITLPVKSTALCAMWEETHKNVGFYSVSKLVASWIGTTIDVFFFAKVLKISIFFDNTAQNLDIPISIDNKEDFD